MPRAPLVLIVDDDESVREALAALLRIFDFDVQAFASAEEFLRAPAAAASCLVLDHSMPGMTGEELQAELLGTGRALPIVFITANTEPALHERLRRRGAVACLVKPFQEDALLSAVKAAIVGRELEAP